MSWFSDIIEGSIRESLRIGGQIVDTASFGKTNVASSLAHSAQNAFGNTKKTSATTATSEVPNYASAEILSAVARRKRKASQQKGQMNANVTGGLYGTNPTLGRSLLYPA